MWAERAALGVSVGATVGAGGLMALEAAEVTYAGSLTIDHAIPRMIQRNIPMRDIDYAIKFGKNFWDPKNESVVSIYGNTAVARAPNGAIKSVFNPNKNPAARWIPL